MAHSITRPLLQPVLVSWLLFAGVILGRFADDAMPTYYVFRPMITVAGMAVILGVAAQWCFRHHAPIAAGVAAVLVSFWPSSSPWWTYLVLAPAGWLLIRQSARIRRTSTPSTSRVTSTAAFVFVMTFFVVGLVRAAVVAEAPVGPISANWTAKGPNIYLVLLDGYPRQDTLREDLGIDIDHFLSELTARGFDVYEDATSDRRLTDLTLLTLLTGTDDGVPADSEFGRPDRRQLRQQLADAVLPREAQRAGYEYIVIDSPVGHVTFSGGTHLQHGGLNTYEERLLGESLLGAGIAALWPALPTDSLRGHLEAGLDSLAELADPHSKRLILAHLLAPHLPFLWDEEGNPLPAPSSWPCIQLYESVTEKLGMPMSEYSAGMRAQLTALNARLVRTVDVVVERDPGAVIVLFGDHGARYSITQLQTEWYRPFLAARTPGHAKLFLRDPSPTAILESC